MTALLTALLTYINANLPVVIASVCNVLVKAFGAIKEYFLYKKVDIQNTIAEREEKEKKEYEEKVDKITTDGTIEDLLNLKRK